MWESFWTDRGRPWEHDPGPAKSSPWLELFAATPNYPALGRERVGADLFRWEFGPMFYRGRLGADQVKVLVIGQEGAQDESLAHRSFVGGSGSRMQHLLDWLGITRSYLFLNTFLYPIHGEYGDRLRPLAQGDSSPIVQHRHQLLELVAGTNELRLVISVGVAARETVETWRRMRGGALPAGTRTVHVVHPGAAAAGSSAAVRKSFSDAVGLVAGWVRDDPGWLAADADGRPRFDQPFVFAFRPVPFRDLPFGITWRLGRGATSSNRRDGDRSIQIFSAAGRYNNSGVTLGYASASGSPDGYRDDPGDLPNEPPKVRFRDFDRGPTSTWARRLMGGEAGLDWPDFSDLGLPGHPSFGFGPIYRGQLNRPSVVVLADQDGQEDLFTGRALCGQAGQRLQRFMDAAGLPARHLVVRVLPVDSRGASRTTLEAAVDNAQVRRVYAAILQHLDAAVLMAIGPLARRLAPAVNARSLPIIEMKATSETGWLADWRAALAALEGHTYRRERQGSFAYDGGRDQIPRSHLPYGTLRWQGSSGDRAVQARIGNRSSPDYFKYAIPAWVESP